MAAFWRVFYDYFFHCHDERKTKYKSIQWWFDEKRMSSCMKTKTTKDRIVHSKVASSLFVFSVHNNNSSKFFIVPMMINYDDRLY